MASVVHISIVPCSGVVGPSGGSASIPSPTYVIDGQEIAAITSKTVSTVISTAAHVGMMWRVAVSGDIDVYGECNTSPVFTNLATAKTKGLLLMKTVEYFRITQAGEKWAVIGVA